MCGKAEPCRLLGALLQALGHEYDEATATAPDDFVGAIWFCQPTPEVRHSSVKDLICT